MRCVKITLAFFSFLIIIFSNCAVSDLISILGKGDEIKKPNWDYEFKAPLVNKSMSIGDLLKDTIDLKTLIADISGDAELDDTDPSGVYRIKYKLDFPKIDNIASSSLNSGITNTFTNSPFSYTTPYLPSYLGISPIWPLPKEIALSENNWYLYYDFSTVGSDKQNLYVDMKSNDINKDLNSDNSDDILFKGISAPEGKIYFRISLLKDDKAVEALKAGEITIDKFTIENQDCTFTLDPSTSFSGGYTKELVYATDIPDPLMFNGFINQLSPSEVFRYFDINDFRLKIATSKYSSLSPITPTEKVSGNLKIRVTSQIEFGGKLYIVGQFYPTVFDLGLSEFSGIKDLTSFFDKTSETTTNELDKLKNRLISSISLGNMTLKLDATNDLPFDIDLNKMFNNTTNYKNLGSYYKDTAPVNQTIDPTSDPTIKKSLWDSGMYTFFDRDGNGVRDTYSLLSPSKINGVAVNSDSFLIKGKTGNVSINLENINEFFQIPNSIDKPTKYVMPKTIYFGKNVDLRATNDTTIDINMFSKSDLIKLNASIELPISLRLYDTTEDIDILKSLLKDTDIGSSIKNITGSLPLGNIEELGLDLEITNSFPFGFSFTFDLITDQSDDANKKTVSLLPNAGSVSINSGSIETDSNGFYLATSNSINNVSLGIRSNFSYLDSKGVSHTYDGDVVKLLNEATTVSISMKMHLLPTTYSGKIIDVILSSQNAIGIKLNASGKTNIDLGTLIK